MCSNPTNPDIRIARWRPPAYFPLNLVYLQLSIIPRLGILDMSNALREISPAVSTSKPEYIELCSSDDLSPINISCIGHRLRSSRPHLCDNLL
jgi:hypothetical protein